MSKQRTGGPRGPKAAVELIRDHQACIPLTRVLDQGDMLLLLTPVVEPLPGDGNSSQDPFEPLGRALAERHGPVAHVPYRTVGMTQFHIDKIKEARTIIFTISGAPTHGQPSQADMAEVVHRAGEHRPQIIVACQNAQDLGLLEKTFPTIIQLPGYETKHQKEAARLLFGEDQPRPSQAIVHEMAMLPAEWTVEPLLDWNRLDIEPIRALWNQCLPDKFSLDAYRLRSLLFREGLARHFVVRKPGTGEILGFCATYTTFVDGNDDKLIGSLAALLVQPSLRNRGIGLSLHDFALSQLSSTRKVGLLQLGTTFPRLLRGVPAEFASAKWFGRRGWPIDEAGAGRSPEVCDFLVGVDDWPPSGRLVAAPQGFTFRQCTSVDEFFPLQDFVFRESFRSQDKNFFEQYHLSQEVPDDIVLGLYGQDIVAAAITYVPNSGSPCEGDLPWARSIGVDVGGISCIVVSEDLSKISDVIAIRLIDACVDVLRRRGMRRIFLDNVKGGVLDKLQVLGFAPWATYRDVWRPVREQAVVSLEGHT